MKKSQALEILQKQVESVDQRYAQQRITGMQRDLIKLALLIAKDTVKEITEIWMFNPIKPNRWELVK